MIKCQTSTRLSHDSIRIKKNRSDQSTSRRKIGELRIRKYRVSASDMPEVSTLKSVNSVCRLPIFLNELNNVSM